MAHGRVRKSFVTLAGTLLVLIGLILIPLPGPGALIVLAGLAVLGTEYAWIKRRTDTMKRQAGTLRERVRRWRHPDGPR